MGLFSKLLGDKNVEKAAGELLKGLFNGGGHPLPGQPVQPQAKPAAPQVQSVQKRPEAYEAAAPSGCSWGETMPSEPNQFNYPGTYRQYFSELFAAEFPSYSVACSDGYGGYGVVYTFTQAGRTALVVEVLSQSSDAQKQRRDCRRAGIPYLRFYHNHDGWWNTRSYVTERVRSALAG